MMLTTSRAMAMTRQTMNPVLGVRDVVGVEVVDMGFSFRGSAREE